MNPQIKLILLIAGAVYLLLIGVALCGLLISTIHTLIQTALNSARRCRRNEPRTRRNP
jgi:hypothetical protein